MSPWPPPRSPQEPERPGGARLRHGGRVEVRGPLAHRFPRLFVLLTEDYKMNPELCRRLADAGHGDVFPVRAFRDLPARLLDVANRVLR